MLTSIKNHFFVIALFVAPFLGSGFISSKAEASSSFFGGFVVGAIAGAVVSHVIHNEWHQGGRSYKRTAKAKQQSRLPQQSSSMKTQDMETINTTTIAKSSEGMPEDKNFRPALQTSSTSIKNQ